MGFRYRKVHFVGIGGIGMSALARVLVDMGVEVTGSDIAENANVKSLRDLGVRVWVPHDAKALAGDVDLVVYSSAVPQDNVELRKAFEMGIPVMKRGELLAAISSEKDSVIVAGSHGKTTTSAMIGKILYDADFSPTVLVGGRIKDFEDTNALMGDGHIIVAESDESDGSFLLLSPWIGVLTNVDREHLNHYGDFEALKRAFRLFLERVREHRVVCADDESAMQVAEGMGKFTYSVRNTAADAVAEDIELTAEGTSFVCRTPWGAERVKIPLAGTYNVSNALAALCAACLSGCSFEKAISSLESFSGVQRRLTVRGYFKGTVLVDDYAHHPTEIHNTLAAVRQRWPGRRVVAVFQPHRYSRMRHLWRDFLNAFDFADELWVTDVYSAGEVNNGFRIEDLVVGLKKRKQAVIFVPSWLDMVPMLKDRLKGNEVLITLGAGDVWKLCEALREQG